MVIHKVAEGVVRRFQIMMRRTTLSATLSLIMLNILKQYSLTLPLSGYNPIITHSRGWLQYPYWYFMTSQVTAPEAQDALSCSTAYLDDDDLLHVLLLWMTLTSMKTPFSFWMSSRSTTFPSGA